MSSEQISGLFPTAISSPKKKKKSRKSQTGEDHLLDEDDDKNDENFNPKNVFRASKREISALLDDLENEEDDALFNVKEETLDESLEDDLEVLKKAKKRRKRRSKDENLLKFKRKKVYAQGGPPWDRDEDIVIDHEYAFPLEDNPDDRRNHSLGCKICAFKTWTIAAMEEHNKRHERIDEVRRGVYYFCTFCDLG